MNKVFVSVFAITTFISTFAFGRTVNGNAEYIIHLKKDGVKVHKMELVPGKTNMKLTSDGMVRCTFADSSGNVAQVSSGNTCQASTELKSKDTVVLTVENVSGNEVDYRLVVE